MSEERKFLHDISTPLATALFVVDSLSDSLKERAEAEGATQTSKMELDQAQRIAAALMKIKLQIEARRHTLVAAEEKK